ncbi:hypothetical protein HMPREF9413_3422 [Paenibacillus sp. HGF7]|nr:hypothetical protein HMPREF9413_3422 [Paenibacillus sp. HGF7]
MQEAAQPRPNEQPPCQAISRRMHRIMACMRLKTRARTVHPRASFTLP